MTTKKKGLKKGSLEFLLSSAGLDETIVLDEPSEGKHVTIDAPARTNNGVMSVDIEKVIRSPYQPRRNFSQESLQELAESIKAKGLIQPIVVRKKNDSYELIAGERRWRACQLIGLHQIPVVIRQVDDETALVMAIVENIQREDLNPIEESRGLQRLIDEFAMTQQQVADVIGRSRSAVTNLLRLLSLEPKVQTMVEEGKIEMGHARALLSLDNPQQIELANRIIFKNASVRETEQWVRDIIHNKHDNKTNASDYITDPNITSLQMRLSETLGARVTINHAHNGKGKLVINYHSIDELDGIIAKIS
jgi:ParB family chromosome partitioning protein